MWIFPRWPAPKTPKPTAATWPNKAIPPKNIKEGIASEEIINYLQDDEKIRFLVLAAADGENPGPLVTLLAGKKSGVLPVPVVVIPSGITNDSIDDLASRAD